MNEKELELNFAQTIAQLKRGLREAGAPDSIIEKAVESAKDDKTLLQAVLKAMLEKQSLIFVSFDAEGCRILVRASSDWVLRLAGTLKELNSVLDEATGECIEKMLPGGRN
jgi:hypothetical protein